MTDHSPEASAPAQPTARPTHTVTIPASVPMVTLLGPRDELLRTIERQFPRVEINVRGNEFRMTGPSADVALVERLLDELLVVLDAGQPLNRDAVERSIGMLRSQTAERPADVLTMNIVSSRGRTIRPKTLNQKRYVDAIDKHTIVFSIGPAGTGKTYLAMAKAVAALQGKLVNRIILTRPAVEAGERLGFLPGTLNDKIDPYLRPLYDALHDMVDPESIPRLMAAGTIEVAPLAYMRGRAQPLDTNVLTTTGYRPFGDLKVGDLVVGSDGLPTPVTGVYPQGRKPVFRLTTDDGASTLCCGEHLWTVRTRGDRRRGRWRTVQTADLARRIRSVHGYRYEVPLVAAVAFAEREVPVHPHALGLILGRGGLMPTSTPSLATAGGRAGLRGSDPMTSVLNELGPGRERATTCVPPVYLTNARWVRAALLQGLLESAAGPAASAGRPGHERFDTTSPHLRDGAVFLVRSLGGVARCRTRSGGRPGTENAAATGAPPGADAYAVDIHLPNGWNVVDPDRPRGGSTTARGRRPTRFITSIEPAGEAETMCIRVAAADNLYVTDDFLVTHNTLNDAFIILDEAQNTSPEQMKMFLTRLGFGSKMVVTGDVTQIDLPGGTQSGLKVVQGILEGIEDVHFSDLTSVDVVRHRLVGHIVDAYGRWDTIQQGTRAKAAGERRRSQ